MSDRHNMMDTCDRCRKRFNPQAGGGLMTIKTYSQTKRSYTLCDGCILDILQPPKVKRVS